MPFIFASICSVTAAAAAAEKNTTVAFFRFFICPFDFRQRKTTQVERLPCNRLTTDQNTNVQSASIHTHTNTHTQCHIHMQKAAALPISLILVAPCRPVSVDRLHFPFGRHLAYTICVSWFFCFVGCIVSFIVSMCVV